MTNNKLSGYNVKFNHAVMRAAQLAHDWGYPGLPMVYSWASEGELAAYWRDEKAVSRGPKLFLQFLQEVVSRTDATNLHIVAHSMGNRLVTQALSTLNQRTNACCVQELVRAAPDHAQRLRQRCRLARFPPRGRGLAPVGPSWQTPPDHRRPRNRRRLRTEECRHAPPQLPL